MAHPLGSFLADLDWTPAADVAGGPSAAAPSFRHHPDAWETPTIWSADPDRPAALLQRHQLPADGLGDALWALIVAAVEGAGR